MHQRRGSLPACRLCPGLVRHPETTPVSDTKGLKFSDCPTGRLEFHPLADLFPLMSAAEADELLVDLKKDHGLRDDIVLYEGKILDGRNRYLGCKALGITPRFEEFTGTEAEALAYVISDRK